jgi:hypothetical protein
MPSLAEDRTKQTLAQTATNLPKTLNSVVANAKVPFTLTRRLMTGFKD